MELLDPLVVSQPLKLSKLCFFYQSGNLGVFAEMPLLYSIHFLRIALYSRKLLPRMLRRHRQGEGS